MPNDTDTFIASLLQKEALKFWDIKLFAQGHSVSKQLSEGLNLNTCIASPQGSAVRMNSTAN